MNTKKEYNLRKVILETLSNPLTNKELYERTWYNMSNKILTMMYRNIWRYKDEWVDFSRYFND